MYRYRVQNAIIVKEGCQKAKYSCEICNNFIRDFFLQNLIKKM